jgi:putative hydrolase of the HAD superfamily
MIKNLLFDFGGVIATLTPEEGIGRFKALGIEDAFEQMGAYGQTGIFRQYEDGTIDSDEFLRQLAKQAHRPSVSFREAQHCWMGYIHDVPMRRIELLKELRRRGYNMALLSNTNPLIAEWTFTPEFSPEGKGIQEYFDKMFLSYKMKAYKPEDAIYLKVMEEGPYKAEETLFIDDGQVNLDAAARLGMHTLLSPKDGEWMDALQAYLKENGAY